MEAYAQALNIAIPFFTLLIVIEILYGVYKKQVTANLPDTISSLSSGITNITMPDAGRPVIHAGWQP